MGVVADVSAMSMSIRESIMSRSKTEETRRERMGGGRGGMVRGGVREVGRQRM